MIETIRKIAGFVAEWSDKAKAVAGAASTFAAVVVAATADDALGLNEITTVLTAAITFGAAVYTIVWRVPNRGFVKVGNDVTTVTVARDESDCCHHHHQIETAGDDGTAA